MEGLACYVVSRMQGPPPKTTHDRTFTKDTDTERPTPYMSWNNFTLEENPTAEPGMEPRTF